MELIFKFLLLCFIQQFCCSAEKLDQHIDEINVKSGNIIPSDEFNQILTRGQRSINKEDSVDTSPYFMKIALLANLAQKGPMLATAVKKTLKGAQHIAKRLITKTRKFQIKALRGKGRHLKFKKKGKLGNAADKIPEDAPISEVATGGDHDSYEIDYEYDEYE